MIPSGFLENDFLISKEMSFVKFGEQTYLFKNVNLSSIQMTQNSGLDSNYFVNRLAKSFIPHEIEIDIKLIASDVSLTNDKKKMLDYLSSNLTEDDLLNMFYRKIKDN
jgi:hypothetical protein